MNLRIPRSLTLLDTPEPDGLSTDSDAPLSKQAFNIPVAQIESIVEPDSVADNIGRESVAFVCVHRRIIPFPAVNLSVP